MLLQLSSMSNMLLELSSMLLQLSSNTNYYVTTTTNEFGVFESVATVLRYNLDNHYSNKLQYKFLLS